jgi:hypothetical protein
MPSYRFHYQVIRSYLATRPQKQLAITFLYVPYTFLYVPWGPFIFGDGEWEWGRGERGGISPHMASSYTFLYVPHTFLYVPDGLLIFWNFGVGLVVQPQPIPCLQLLPGQGHESVCILEHCKSTEKQRRTHHIARARLNLIRSYTFRAPLSLNALNPTLKLYVPIRSVQPSR